MCAHMCKMICVCLVLHHSSPARKAGIHLHYMQQPNILTHPCRFWMTGLLIYKQVCRYAWMFSCVTSDALKSWQDAGRFWSYGLCRLRTESSGLHRLPDYVRAGSMTNAEAGCKAPLWTTDLDSWLMLSEHQWCLYAAVQQKKLYPVRTSPSHFPNNWDQCAPDGTNHMHSSKAYPVLLAITVHYSR